MRISSKTKTLARSLGWFSVGLGIAELAIPRYLGKLTGVRDNTKLMRTMGARKLANGIGILAQPRARWLWTRVGGDALDLALLGAAMKSSRSGRARLAASTATVAGVTALDILCSRRM